MGIISLPATVAQGEAKYVFIKKSNNISLFYRWIELPDKRKVRELKAELDISASPEQIIATLRDEKVALNWLKGASEVKSVGSPGQNLWHTYIQYDIPWPLSNQDCIIRYNLESSNKQYMINMTGLPKYIPEKEGITRIQHLQGSWIIVPTNRNVCKVFYSVFSNQEPTFPRWITDPIIQGNLISTMEAFRTTVEKNN